MATETRKIFKQFTGNGQEGDALVVQGAKFSISLWLDTIDAFDATVTLQKRNPDEKTSGWTNQPTEWRDVQDFTEIGEYTADNGDIAEYRLITTAWTSGIINTRLGTG